MGKSTHCAVDEIELRREALPGNASLRATNSEVKELNESSFSVSFRERGQVELSLDRPVGSLHDHDGISVKVLQCICRFPPFVPLCLLFFFFLTSFSSFAQRPRRGSGH